MWQSLKFCWQIKPGSEQSALLCSLMGLTLKAKSWCVVLTTECVLQKNNVLTDVSKPQTNLDNNPCSKISVVFWDAAQRSWLLLVCCCARQIVMNLWFDLKVVVSKNKPPQNKTPPPKRTTTTKMQTNNNYPPSCWNPQTKSSMKSNNKTRKTKPKTFFWEGDKGPVDHSAMGWFFLAVGAWFFPTVLVRNGGV